MKTMQYQRRSIIKSISNTAPIVFDIHLIKYKCMLMLVDRDLTILLRTDGVNSLRPRDAWMRHYAESTLLPIRVCHMISAMSLLDSFVIYCIVSWTIWEQTLKFTSN